jgi:hypothetical protein
VLAGGAFFEPRDPAIHITEDSHNGLDVAFDDRHASVKPVFQRTHSILKRIEMLVQFCKSGIELIIGVIELKEANHNSNQDAEGRNAHRKVELHVRHLAIPPSSIIQKARAEARAFNSVRAAYAFTASG